LYLFDHKGLIREVFHGRVDDKVLEATVNALVEAAGKGP
jgi:hypothetical protein